MLLAPGERVVLADPEATEARRAILVVRAVPVLAAGVAEAGAVRQTYRLQQCQVVAWYRRFGT